MILKIFLINMFWSLKMTYSNVEKKKLRKNFGKYNKILEIPYLISLQIESFKKFINKNIKKNIGIESIFKHFFPIYNHNFSMVLQYINYEILKPEYTYQECKDRGITYQGLLKVDLRLIIYNNNKNIKTVKFVKTRTINMCEIPLITKNATFVVNGVERVVISQLHRSPGVFFDHDKGRSNTFKKILYNARLIPYSGPWLDFEFDSKDVLYIKINRQKKIPATIILRALNYTTQQILSIFYDHIIFDISDKQVKINLKKNKLKNEIAMFDIIVNKKIYVKKGEKIKKKIINKLKKDHIKNITVPSNFVYSKTIAEDYYDKNGELICMANMSLTKEIIINLKKNGYKKIKVIFTNNIDRGNYISNTLHSDPTYDRLSALIEIYHVLKPDNIATLELATSFFENLFFTGNKYNLSKVGRIKLNYSVSRLDNFKSIYLDKKDIILIIKKLLNIRNGKEKLDDIDNLNNRRIRSVGEMINNHFYLCLMRIKSMIKEKLIAHKKKSFPKHLVNFKILTTYIKEFFISNPLSQFLDQNNPLSAITHKRRISALGPGGLTLKRASFEIRDIHYTHYGRICPIETPEGPNIGLINSLSIYSQVNQYGFLETPYRLIKKNKVTNEIYYLSSNNEEKLIIAQANTKINKKNEFINKLINCRYKNQIGLFNKKRVNYMDISNQQILSLGASLIPFLEHNDANRSLMGSNMQRQAVPSLINDAPIVGTGMERIIAADTDSIVFAHRGGIIKYLDSSKIIIKVNNKEIINNKNNLDTYNLIKYIRSNQNTCINQTPCVSLGEKISKGDVIADGPSTDKGELALGQNIRVAFMPWNGYNFEDAVLISEKIIQQNKFTTIHIHELSCEIKDTKVNREKITINIPGIPKNFFSKLDKNGIIKIGTEVYEGDILVSKIIQKKEQKLKAEEKLLLAIFGNKSTEIQDSSLRVPNGIFGTVIDVKIFEKYENKEENEKKKKIKQIKKIMKLKGKKALEKYKKEI
ncbi:MAG: DNA-directed RNA polymerase subunit beta [Enterobacteriaceae bacterium PSpyr]|nr:MAG: DNA-directed RNA polymerase subunit beta [Enterobacteriaceae bacterium PSpyr]